MKKVQIILVACAVLGIACYVVYRQTAIRYEKKLTQALEQERNEYWDRVGILEKNVAELEDELAGQRESIVPQQRLAEVYGDESVPSTIEESEVDCQALQRQVLAVFSYLDNKEYIQSHDLPGGTHELFQVAVNQLSQHLPLVSGEMKDMVSLTRNVAHFFRALGEMRIGLFKKIMAEEDEVMEAMMNTLFSWFLSCDRCEDAQIACPPTDVLYRYAGFFLNTLAGKSYLLRRDSKVRVLTTYYCVLILDKANKEMLNRDGIDIKHFIYYLFKDISNQKGLAYKNAYLNKLKRLRDIYQARRR
jgi:hypothetical protein